MNRQHLASMLALLALAPVAVAQDKDSLSEIRSMCNATVATLMIGKVDCTAALCNTGSAQEGVSGLLARVMVRDSIDAASFGAGVVALLSTALKKTGCFEIFDPVAAEGLRKELATVGGSPAAAPTVDYIVKVSITKAERTVDQSSFIFYKKETATSTLGLDTKLLHAARGSVLVAGSYEASTDRSSSGLAIPLFSQTNSAARADPFAGAARDAVVKATNGLTGQILALLGAQGPRPEPPAAPAEPAQAGAAIGASAPQ